MIIWFATLIPIICCIIAYFIWGKKYQWWEFLLPTIVCFLMIFIIKITAEKSLISDIQYKSGLIVEARYYEYYSTWVDATCYTTESYACGTDSDGRTIYCTKQVPYDCSYCDENPPYWKVYDDQGNSWRISGEKYIQLVKLWNKHNFKKIDLNRSIDYRRSCGLDGDAFSVSWNQKVETSETSTWSSSYDNKPQVSKSNFDLTEITKKEAKKYGLYDYPVIQKYNQEFILGIDSVRFLDKKHKLQAKQLISFFNGYYGPKRKIKLYVLLFSDKPLETALYQKSYWDGGNKNEVVICIDVDKNNGKINWVYPFSWTVNKRVEIDLREDISNLDTLDFKNLYPILEKSTEKFVYRDFKEFDFLSVDAPTWLIWLVYLLTTFVTFGLLYYGYQNDYENE